VERRFDVVVCGGGSAGCVLAARLSEDPARSVCLVEAGPDYGPFAAGRWPADLLDGRRLAFSHSWETEREDRSQLRARVLGGCSAHNACAVLEGTPADYDEWGPGWTYAELEPFLRRAARELRTRTFLEEELSPWHRAFAEAGGAGAIVHPANAVGTVRWNTAFAYLDPARGRPNLTILADTLVDRIDPERGLVHTDGQALTAGTIVLAAGAYGSPGILLRSGVGPGLAHDLPVGDGLADHVGAGVGWQPTALLQEDTARFESEHPLFMAQVTVRVGDVFLFPGLDPGYEISAAAFFMKPASRGRVRLNGADPRTPLAIEHGFLADDRDVAPLVDGVETLRALVADEPLRRYVAGELRPGADVSAENHVRAAARGFFHPVGTCAIGSVVDARGRVLGLEHVLVADASIMPTIPRANTNLTAVAIGERIAGWVAQPK
jgi:choline dehydrogenase-like flavoprotein